MDSLGRHKSVAITRPRPVLLEALPSEAERAGGLRTKKKGTSSYLHIAVGLIRQSLGMVATEHPDVVLWSEMTSDVLVRTEAVPLQ